jgi:hypothetical protein
MPRQDKQLVRALHLVWETANNAQERIASSHASYVDLARALCEVAEQAAEALADQPFSVELLTEMQESA